MFRAFRAVTDNVCNLSVLGSPAEPLLHLGNGVCEHGGEREPGHPLPVPQALIAPLATIVTVSPVAVTFGTISPATTESGTEAGSLPHPAI